MKVAVDKSFNIFKVMVDPRGSMRSIIALPLVFSLLFAFFYGFDYIVSSSIHQGYQANGFSMPVFLLLTFIFSLPLGYLFVVVAAAIYLWVGKILKGKSNYKNMIKALFLPKIIQFFQSVLLVFLLGVYGKDLFVLPVMHMLGFTFFTVIVVAHIILGIWGFILLLHTVGEAQQFSAWMALWNIILGGIVFMLIFMILFIVVSFFIQAPVASLIVSKLNLIIYHGASYVC